MDASLALARQAAEEGEVPVGCVIAREGRILVGDYNGRETFKNASNDHRQRRHTHLHCGHRCQGMCQDSSHAYMPCPRDHERNSRTMH
ncbi:MAG: hypothetical protein IIU08_00350, partial [Clostridia bacterium]|nr:hypothetical protein [Clostridia bacterium]